eukprot:1811299-Rhodomonas_salina.2
MSKSAFAHLVNLLVPALESEQVQTGRCNSAAQLIRASRAGEITMSMKVSMTLRWLAGGSYLNIIAYHGVSEASFCACKNQVIDAILTTECLKIVFPSLDDSAVLRNLAHGFQAKSEQGVMREVVGALEGILIDLEYVGFSDSPFPARFWTRKSSFALNVQAICNAH